MANARGASGSKSHNGSETPAAAEALHMQVDALRDDIRSLADNMTRLGSAVASDAGDIANTIPDEAMEAYRSSMTSIQREYDQIEKSLRRQVRSNPMQSLALALGAGVLVALVLRR